MDPDGDGRYYIELQVNSRGTIRDLLADGSVKAPTYPQYDVMAKWDFQNLRKARTGWQNGKPLLDRDDLSTRATEAGTTRVNIGSGFAAPPLCQP